jgi:hypothetical protein
MKRRRKTPRAALRRSTNVSCVQLCSEPAQAASKIASITCRKGAECENETPAWQ